MDNVFKDNVGLSGGALHIDLQLSKNLNRASQDLVNEFTPYVFVQGNHFERNMAYTNGNAIFIKGG